MTDTALIRDSIASGKSSLGIELGSTRIKAVLIGPNNQPIASGGHGWENSYVNGNWTYSLDEVWSGIQAAYAELVDNVKQTYQIELSQIASLGFSAMMHGYLAFDKNDNLLTPFRTWRNNNTLDAATELMALFQHPIPQRWSISHLYQSILNKEAHTQDIDFFTTLAGYVHWQLTGEKVLGIGDASGMFPIDVEHDDYHHLMVKQFDDLVAKHSFTWSLADILPKALLAGENAGTLTAAGAKLLDPTGQLQAGCPLCPPEGDAGTGMVATNSVAARTGNVSAGTSIFAMVVLDGPLSKVHPELDLVTTPSGKLVAMAHSNNCSSNIDSWMSLFAEAIQAMGLPVDTNTLYQNLYAKALEGDKDCGGLLSYGYLSGEHITHFSEGRPLFVRSADSNMNLANFMRVNIQTSLGAMKIGIDKLVQEEGLTLEKILAHGGLFKTEKVGQTLLAGALNAPVAVMATAGEGGAWGIALLAAYLSNRADGETLDEYLNNHVFSANDEKVIEPDPADVAGFETFMARYKQGLAIERAAIETL
jgi:sugar (pentulose or hexulose) kinase